MAKGETFAVGWSSYGMDFDEFTASLWGLAFNDAYGPRRIDRGRSYRVKGPYLPQNRSDLARIFLAGTQETKTPWFVSIDTDTCFEPKAIYDLVDFGDAVERPIVTAAQYGFIGGGDLSLIWLKARDLGKGKEMTVVGSAPDIMEIDACGMGFCAIHRSVFERMIDTHPDDDWNTFGHDAAWNPDRQRTVYLGEDVTFCLRAKALGFSVWGNPFIEVDHMKVGRQNRHTRVVTLDYDANGSSRPALRLV